MLTSGRISAARIGAALAVTGLAACSSGNAINTGPFGNGDSDASICGWVHGHGGVATFGGDELHNRGKSTAVVERVTLTNAKNLVIVRAWVVPVNGPDLMGGGGGWPGRQRMPGVFWSRRARAAGAHVPPAHGQHTADLVLLLKPTARKGTSTDIDVYYREAGQEYHLRYNTALVMRTSTSVSCW
jgi:hypothetical protein